MPDPSVIEALTNVIAERKARASAEGSYVAQLMQAGVKKIRVKVVEEAAEVFEAALETGEEGRVHLVKETADLVFHALVLLGCLEISWSDVEAELARRFGISGLEEKAARGGDAC